jgi:hypothetical protein
LTDIEHSLDICTMEIMDVALFWRERESDVRAMGCRRFADLQEYMFLHNERISQMNSGTPKQQDDGGRIYAGPKNKNG